MSSFANKVVVITGASAGLGEAIALMMAQKGACLTLCGRDTDKLDRVLQKCCLANGNHNERLLAVTGDVVERNCRKKILDSTLEKFGKIDILVPNAGVSFPGLTLESASEEMYDKLMDINLKSVFFLIQEATQYLEISKGVIVCMSSLYATIPTARTTVYAMSKAAMDHMIRCLSLSLGPKGIRINGVKPSYVPTEITRSYPNADNLVAIHSKNERPFHPLEERCCTPEEVAEAVLFLASSTSSFITGDSIHVDGGRRFFPG